MMPLPGAWLFVALLAGTPAGVTLSGTVTGDQPHALLRDAAGSERLYRIGDRVGDCSLASIAAGRVALACPAGRHVVLILEGRNGAVAVRSAAADEKTVHVPQARVAALLADRQRLVGAVSLTPEVRAGETRAWRIAQIDTKGVLAATGLKPDDRIVSVNGVPVADASMLAEVIRAAATQRAFSIGFERAGQARALHVVLD